MSLATRLSAFFLAALALVLAGFSAILYVTADSYLVAQLDERLSQALETLEASVDIEPGGLEWEPTDRQMSLGVDPAPSSVRWAVLDGRGRPIDRSANTRTGGLPPSWMPARWPADPPDGTVFGDLPGWRLAARRLRIEELLRLGRGHPDDEPGYEVQYPTLVVVAGLSPAPVHAMMRHLGMILTILSGVVWISAAAMGQWLCRRALAPVSRMARTATAMTAADLGPCLPISGTGDELDELGAAFNDLLGRLRETFDRQHEAFERQRRFAGDASHQLRTPLAALLGQVQVARRRDRDPEDYKRVLDLVHAEGTRLRQIVETLLFLSQPEDGPLEALTLDLGDWAADHLRRWSDHPRAADIRAEGAHGRGLSVRVHPTLLAQLVDNLLENACKYSKPGTPIVVRTGRDRDSIVLEVEDRGCGLSADDLPHVFEPFFRSDRARRDGQEGVGLGLAVAQRIAATFGGTIELRSEPGAGSVFAVRLPAAAGEGGPRLAAVARAAKGAGPEEGEPEPGLVRASGPPRA